MEQTTISCVCFTRPLYLSFFVDHVNLKQLVSSIVLPFTIPSNDIRNAIRHPLICYMRGSASGSIFAVACSLSELSIGLPTSYVRWSCTMHRTSRLSLCGDVGRLSANRPLHQVEACKMHYRYCAIHTSVERKRARQNKRDHICTQSPERGHTHSLRVSHFAICVSHRSGTLRILSDYLEIVHSDHSSPQHRPEPLWPIIAFTQALIHQATYP